MSKKNQAAKTGAQSTALADPTKLFEQHAGEGLENVTGKDILVPRLALLQQLSPQLSKKRPEFIEGGEVGDIADLGTGEIFEAPLHFLPVHYSKIYIEWLPDRKGLAEIHYNAAILDQCDDNFTLPNGNKVQETHQFFGLNLDAQCRRSFISFASTQIKKARKWNTLATSEKVERADGTLFTPPLFFRSYVLGSAEESKSGNDWAGWTVDRGKAMQDLPDFAFVYDEATNFRKSLLAGEAKADNSDLGGVVEEDNTNGEGRM